MIVALRAAVVLALVAALLGGAAWSYRAALIYPFLSADAPPQTLPRTRLRVLPAHGQEPALTVWVTEPAVADGPVLIYFMGEAGALSVYEPRLEVFAEAGFGIAAMAYRGGGGQPGEPSEATLHRDATRLYAGLHTLFDRPVPARRRVIYGQGFGTGPALGLAAAQEELAVVLEAPFPRLCDLGGGLARVVPGCFLYGGHEFENAARIDAVDAPLLILHGARDDRVPVAEARALFDRAVEPKFLEIYDDGGHDNLWRIGAAEDAITFLRVLTGAR